MKLNNTAEPNYSKFCLRLLITTWIFIIVVLAADSLTVFFEAKFYSQSLFKASFKSYVLIPGAFNLVAMTVVHIASTLLLKRQKYISQAVVYLLGITFICFILARSNQDLSLNLIFFALPIVISIFYFDIKVLTFGFAFTLVGFAIHVMLLINATDKKLNETLLPVNIEATFVIMIIIFVICFQIIKRHEELSEVAEQAEEKQQKDHLTGYLNHSGFYKDLDEVYKNSSREKGEFCLALIDIDNFTVINDEYGHGLGDEVIEVMVDCINKSLVNTASVYRYGGEEFVIICKSQHEIVINMIDSIIREFRNKTEMKIGILVTASAGICEYDPRHFKGKRDMFAAVDEALYAAKRLGKNQYALWNEALVRDSFVSTGKLVANHENG